MELDGRTALVTGGGNGIGAALVRAFAREGARVVVADLDGTAADRVAAEVGGTGLQADVGSAEGNATMVTAAEDAVGPIDLLALNAGIGVGGGVEAPDEDWDRAWRVNTMAHVWAVRAWLPSVLERGEGYLLVTASAAGLLTNIGAAPYSVTKHGAVALAEWLAVTHGDQGLKVSCLCPQFVQTNLLEGLKEMPGGRGLAASGVISPDDVAAAVVDGVRAEHFLVLPHPEVADFERNRANDRDRWLAGMRKLQRRVMDAG